MRVWIAAVGSRARDSFDAPAQIYLERIAGYLPGSAGKPGVEAPLFRSEEALWEAVERERARTAPLVVLLDEHGKTMGSETFAAWLGRERDEGRQLVIFAVGPAHGWSEKAAIPRVRGSASRQRDEGAGQTEGGQAGREKTGAQRAGLVLSLGPMTLAHELARVVLCEQVYRALTILAGHPYHRG